MTRFRITAPTRVDVRRLRTARRCGRAAGRRRRRALAIREQAGIATHGWDYGQSGIVTTVAHERDHHGRAEEHFLPAGPFAILPLTGHRSSIVWTEDAREAERIVALPDDDFHAELERRFGLHLGEIAVVGPRRAYPLGLFDGALASSPSASRWSATPRM